MLRPMIAMTLFRMWDLILFLWNKHAIANSGTDKPTIWQVITGLQFVCDKVYTNDEEEYIIWLWCLWLEIYDIAFENAVHHTIGLN